MKGLDYGVPGHAVRGESGFVCPGQQAVPDLPCGGWQGAPLGMAKMERLSGQHRFGHDFQQAKVQRRL